MNNICDFIKTNIVIRKQEVTMTNFHYIDKHCLNLLNLNNVSLLNKFSPTNPDNIDLIYKLSSKSFDSPSTMISNRIDGLGCMLANINYSSGIEFTNINYVGKYKYFLITFYILAGQVFSDGNHRVCYQYLLANNIEKSKISNIIEIIDSCRRNKKIDWDNLHKFIQKIIDNMVLFITRRDENLILEKIENLFV
jgi:hypothetical protein